MEYRIVANPNIPKKDAWLLAFFTGPHRIQGGQRPLFELFKRHGQPGGEKIKDHKSFTRYAKELVYRKQHKRVPPCWQLPHGHKVYVSKSLAHRHSVGNQNKREKRAGICTDRFLSAHSHSNTLFVVLNEYSSAITELLERAAPYKLAIMPNTTYDKGRKAECLKPRATDDVVTRKRVKNGNKEVFLAAASRRNTVKIQTSVGQKALPRQPTRSNALKLYREKADGCAKLKPLTDFEGVPRGAVHDIKEGKKLYEENSVVRCAHYLFLLCMVVELDIAFQHAKQKDHLTQYAQGN